MASTKKKTAKKTAAKKPAAPKRSVRATSAPAKPPSSKQLADLLGVKLTARLRTDQVRRLRKATPGYINIVDNAADELEVDLALLHPKGVTPAGMRELQAQQKDLAAREAVAFAVYRSVYEQRLGVDDQLMKILDLLARRVNALQSDDPDLLDRWKSVLDYLATFHRGPNAPADDGGDDPTDPPAKS